MDGIQNIRINPVVASLVIQYDPDIFPPDLWERLIAGSDEEAARIFERVMTDYRCTEYRHQQTGA